MQKNWGKKTWIFVIEQLRLKCGIDENLLLQKRSNKKKLGQMDKNTAKNCHLYAPISQKQKLFPKSKSNSLNVAHEPKTSLNEKKLVHTAILLTFTIRSKRRMNKQYVR